MKLIRQTVVLRKMTLVPTSKLVAEMGELAVFFLRARVSAE
jgi:hypothetical protein